MSVETFDFNANNEAVVAVSSAAAKHFEQQITRSGGIGVRITLKHAGCTGYKYEINEISELCEGDVKLTLDNKVDVYIDSQYLHAIQGTEIDLRKQGLNNNLVLENPNVKHACGCGESFNFE